MRFFDYIKLAFKNLWRNKMRTFLTITAVVIGAVSVLSLVTLVFTARSFFLQQLEAIGALTQVVVTPDIEVEGGSDPFGGGGGDGGSSSGKKMDDTTVAELKQIPNVIGVSPTISVWAFETAKLKGAEKKYRFNFVAYDPIPEFDKELIAGRNLKKEDVAKIVISGQLLSAFGLEDKADQAIGKKVILTTRRGYSGWGVEPVKPPVNADRDWWDAQQEKTYEIEAEIIGVTIPGPGDYQNYTNLSWAKETMTNRFWESDETERRRLENQGIYNQNPLKLTSQNEIDRQGYGTILVKVDETNNVEAVAEEVKKLGLGAQTTKDFLDEFSKITRILGIILGAIGGVSLGVAAIGIINTMVMAIYERTREIGIMRACGATRATVRRLFTFEAALIGFWGGALGVCIVLGLSKIANIYGNKILASEQIGMTNLVELPLWLIGGVIGLTTLVGLLAGLGPAIKAARLNPVDALRYE